MDNVIWLYSNRRNGLYDLPLKSTGYKPR